jgi:hypothetical protein
MKLTDLDLLLIEGGVRKRKRRVNYEDAEQQEVFSWLKSYHYRIYDLTFSIPNGGSRGKYESAMFKLTGVKPGVPDMFCAYPAGPYHGLFIEMKRKIGDGTGKPVTSKEQKEWQTRLRAQGYVCYVCYGADEAIDTINKYLRLK